MIDLHPHGALLHEWKRDFALLRGEGHANATEGRHAALFVLHQMRHAHALHLREETRQVERQKHKVAARLAEEGVMAQHERAPRLNKLGTIVRKQVAAQLEHVPVFVPVWQPQLQAYVRLQMRCG